MRNTGKAVDKRFRVKDGQHVRFVPAKITEYLKFVPLFRFSQLLSATVEAVKKEKKVSPEIHVVTYFVSGVIHTAVDDTSRSHTARKRMDQVSIENIKVCLRGSIRLLVLFRSTTSIFQLDTAVASGSNGRVNTLRENRLHMGITKDSILQIAATGSSSAGAIAMVFRSIRVFFRFDSSGIWDLRIYWMNHRFEVHQSPTLTSAYVHRETRIGTLLSSCDRSVPKPLSSIVMPCMPPATE
ncbi:hypothetical protein M231_03081 [Tremella mesenterica]|uniref:Uncharacterized protein n=1 Tax=Tremella mesenterica TaxID=5217 RepID=A0A4Q1BNZ3_TREME|nr:hypothetical protein M231_03081 [Tremella mesenterica]